MAMYSSSLLLLVTNSTNLFSLLYELSYQSLANPGPLEDFGIVPMVLSTQQQTMITQGYYVCIGFSLLTKNLTIGEEIYKENKWELALG